MTTSKPDDSTKQVYGYSLRPFLYTFCPSFSGARGVAAGRPSIGIGAAGVNSSSMFKRIFDLSSENEEGRNLENVQLSFC